ncbi:MAG: tRNA (N6-isopentenyl adenosine(37)-C2)-methylthiotransferase MiaB [Gammaproteobacteria bacterium RIFCSPHIGHO2_02_FULL_42_13]|nr:MAG: tRNA (N6-isopentenyl adenosine(37)-C2)-methylthiotransferase MiaB [Gammaproteobacteria bacterium RIFCSPHIGHO2_02_FULL_42_13]OGT67844.1 MAG: tRNA (N6-isopentenyl adenosine(37)-C2)-methylthiotransferase MiaB [Gammaproteobacteria bacterium RIFCSPLOWO2_02_FULL_42_9]
MTLKLYIKIFGCQMNEYDAARIIDYLKQSYKIILTECPENADLILLITCSVRDKAQEKVFSDLGRFRFIQQEKPDVMIGVGGCVASQEGKAILRRAPYVNIIFGPQTLHRLPDMIKTAQTTKKSVIDVSFPEIEKFDHLPTPHADGPSAYVSIMEGCNNYCSYCIVPFTRGKEISRPLENILKEIDAFTKQQVKEIILLGQNVNNYKDGHFRLENLLHRIAENKYIRRIRFLTSHPAYFTDELIETYKQIPKLVSHLHLPVQSGSDHVLKMMRRRYTVEQFNIIINKLRNARPAITISTDFIVGFPGETEEDFENTMQLARNIGFDASYSFIYSQRPGTTAADLVETLSLATKKQRLDALQALLQQSAQHIGETMIGTVQSVLVTKHARKDASELCGRTENNRIVNFAGDSTLIGEFVPVKITEVRTNTLRGEIA